MVANRFDFIIQGKNAAGAAFSSVKKGFGEIDTAAGKSTRNINQRLANLGKRIGGVGKTLATGLVAGTAAAGSAIAGFTIAVINSDRELQVAADRAGRTASQMRILRDAAVEVGEDIGTAEGLLETFNERVQEAAEGTGEGAEVFKLLGISLKDSSGVTKSSNELFVELSKSLNGMGNRADAAALATRLLGGDGFKLIPALDGIEDSLLGTNEEFDAQIKASKDAAKQWRELKKGVTDFAAQAVRPLIPFISDLLTGITDISNRIQDALGPSFLEAGEGAESTGKFLKGVGTIIKETLIPAFGNIAKGIGDFIENTGGVEAWRDRLAGVFGFIGKRIVELTAGFRRVSIIASLAFGETTWQEARDQLSEVTAEALEQKKAIEGATAATIEGADAWDEAQEAAAGALVAITDGQGKVIRFERKVKNSVNDSNDARKDAKDDTGVITENVQGAADAAAELQEELRATETHANNLAAAAGKIKNEFQRALVENLVQRDNETLAQFRARQLRVAQALARNEQTLNQQTQVNRAKGLRAFHSISEDLIEQTYNTEEAAANGVLTLRQQEERALNERLQKLDRDRFAEQLAGIDTTTRKGLQEGIALADALLEIQENNEEELETLKQYYRDQGFSEAEANELALTKIREDNAKKAADTLLKENQRATDKLKTDISGAIQGLITGTESWSSLLDKVKNNALNSIVKKISDNVAGSIAGAWTSSTNGAKTGFTNLANSLTGNDGLFGGFFKWLGDSFSSIFNGAKNLLSNLFGGIFGGSGGSGGPIQNIVNTAVPQLAKTVGGAGTAAATLPAVAPVLAGPASPTLIGAGTGTAAATTGGAGTAAGAGSGLGALGALGLFAGGVGLFGFLGRSRESETDRARKRLLGADFSDPTQSLTDQQRSDFQRSVQRKAKDFDDREEADRTLREFGEEARKELEEENQLRLNTRKFNARERRLEIERRILARAALLRAEEAEKKRFGISDSNLLSRGLQFGGLIQRRPGGVLANIGEGRFDEAVLPLPQGINNFVRAVENFNNLNLRNNNNNSNRPVNINITVNSDGGVESSGDSGVIDALNLEGLKDVIDRWFDDAAEPGGKLEVALRGA